MSTLIKWRVIMKVAIYSRKSVFTGKGESIENQIQLLIPTILFLKMISMYIKMKDIQEVIQTDLCLKSF